VNVSAHVFLETNFLFSAFRMPSKRNRDALALKASFDAGAIMLYVPYICFQEARYLIAKSLPSNRCSDLLEFIASPQAQMPRPGITAK
jgi:predicted nucleic acid-binding protein